MNVVIILCLLLSARAEVNLLLTVRNYENKNNLDSRLRKCEALSFLGDNCDPIFQLTVHVTNSRNERHLLLRREAGPFTNKKVLKEVLQTSSTQREFPNVIEIALDIYDNDADEDQLIARFRRIIPLLKTGQLDLQMGSDVKTVSLLETRRQIPPGRHHNSTRRIIRCQVKLSVRADREAWWTRKAEEMEDAKNAGNVRKLFHLIRSIGPRKPLASEIIRDQNGSLICSKAEGLDRWTQYFEQQFSRPPATFNPESWPSTERTNRRHKFRLRVLVTMVIIAFSVKTIRRNFDWTDEYNLFSSALKVNPRNAKMWNNVGHALEARGEFRQALGYFQKAVEVQPNDIGARINVGRTYVNLQMPKEAEIAYFGALDYFPKPKKGQTYYARVAPKDLMVFINLANLYLNKTPPLLEDAARLLRRAISLRSDFVDAYQNYGSVLIKQGKADEAETVYRTALTYQERNPDLNYNLGVVLLESGRRAEGLFYLNNALKYKPEHLPTMFAMASTLTETTDPVDRERGKHLLESLAERRYEFAKVHFALGMLETDLKNYKKAASHYYKTIEAEPDHRSALFNLALLSRNQLNDCDSAIPLLKRILQVYPDHVKSYLLLGDIELTERKKPELALKLFRRALELDPTNVQAKHNLCIALAEQDDLEASEECLLQAIQMAPHEDYLKEHLAIVRRRLDPE
ncbi:transmembrane and TPR repeat-containing protein 3 [Clonorchis sinensis]|uniref:Transmembrane and TPR repeat-containing protein 3 n=1 Tax=Clonorchis sinensis TaxID=79923 RepID=G7YLE9_CLOSI|nr:transmembrane and TPR repeat-containing protein 3 [Clonorchis sinensis]